MTGNWHLDHPTHPIPTKERHCINLGGGVHPLNKIHMQRCFKGLTVYGIRCMKPATKTRVPWDSLYGLLGIRCMAAMWFVVWQPWDSSHGLSVAFPQICRLVMKFISWFRSIDRSYVPSITGVRFYLDHHLIPKPTPDRDKWDILGFNTKATVLLTLQGCYTSTSSTSLVLLTT